MLKKHNLLTLATFIGLVAVAEANAAVYVDPINGRDTNPGSQALPFKTISRALSISSTTEINLALGNYSVNSGETFGWNFGAFSLPLRIVGVGMTATVIDAGPLKSKCMPSVAPKNVTFEGLSFKNCNVTSSTSPARSFFFKNTFLENFQVSFSGLSTLRIENSNIAGSSGFFASNGAVLDFSNTDVNGANNGLFAFASLDNASLFSDGLVVHDLVTSSVVIDVTNQSSAEIYSSQFIDSWGTLNNDNLDDSDGSRLLGATIRVTEQSRVINNGSKLKINNTTINGSAGAAIYGDTSTSINVSGGSYTGNYIGIYADGASSYLNNDAGFNKRATFNNTLANWIVYTAAATLNNGSFRGGTYGVRSLDNGTISISNSAFENVSRPIQFESIDSRQSGITLGSNLTFRGGGSRYISLVADCTERTTLAVNNNTTWRPNSQGADSTGHISPRVVSGATKGTNYWLKSSNCKLNIF